MASIRREIVIDAPPDHVWAAVRDVGAPHKRLAPRFVVEARLEGETRVVTFADGLVVREPIVDIDDDARRLVWGAVGSRLTHYNASMQVFADGEGRSRVVWIADLLPHEFAGYVAGNIEKGLGIMKKTLEQGAVRGIRARHTSVHERIPGGQDGRKQWVRHRPSAELRVAVARGIAARRRS